MGIYYDNFCRWLFKKMQPWWEFGDASELYRKECQALRVRIAKLEKQIKQEAC